MPFVFRRGMIKLAPRWGDCFIRRDGSSLRPSPLRPPCTQFLSLMHAVLKHGSRAQEEGLFKAVTLQAVPAFVANSRQMLLLVDGTYFKRLWCNYELAVAAKTVGHVQILPIWEPVWTLSSLGVGCIFAIVWFTYQSKPRIDGDSDMAPFWAMCNYFYLPWHTALLLAIPLAWISLAKLDRHRLLLDQMANFDLRQAECALESDRFVIQEHVLSLFDEALEPPVSVAFGAEPDESEETLISPETFVAIRHVTSYPNEHEVLDQFNAYIHGPLRKSVVDLLGQEVHVSVKLCLISIWPGWLYGLMDFFSCDFHTDCQTAASSMGYPSLFSYLLMNAMVQLITTPLFSLLILPSLLRCNNLVARRVETPGFRMLCGSCSSAIVLSLCNTIGGIWVGSFLMFTIHHSIPWLAFFLLETISAFGLGWLLHKPMRAPAGRDVCCEDLRYG
ncbi:unnamed protein product [Durusdinium trenchii]|uniref:Uncharacterized protein n=1 Tax=Durusdinium trenchii TaxID=1381693 RepID=A0ABP0SG06_9DINO